MPQSGVAAHHHVCVHYIPNGNDDAGWLAAPNPRPFPNGDAAGAAEAVGSIGVVRPLKPKDPKSTAGDAACEALAEAPRFAEAACSRKSVSTSYGPPYTFNARCTRHKQVVNALKAG